MPSRRLSSSSSTRLGRADSHRQDSQKLDVVFNTDPMFVQAGNGKAVPRGLSGVEHDQSAAPVLNFRSDDAYATMSEISRRASAAKEMKAALKAQIAAKRTLESGVADDDDYEVQPTERSIRSVRTVQLSARDSRPDMPASRPSSMPLRSDRAHTPPQLNFTTNDTSTATAARRAIAAQELKNALEAQMQAKMMLEGDGAAQINGESSQLTDNVGTGSLMEYSASNLAAWELGEGSYHSSFFNDARLPSWTQSGLTDTWQKSLRKGEDRRSSTPPFAYEYSVSPEAAPARRTSVHSALDNFPRQPKRLSVHDSPSPEAKHASGSPSHRSTSRSMTSSPPAGAVGSNPNIGAQTQQPLLRFRSDNHFETSQELAARAERQNRQRAELDAQIAEKQARLEAEQAEASARRSPLANQAARSSAPPAATPAALVPYPVRADSASIDRANSRGGSSGHHNSYSLVPAGTAAGTVDGSPVQSTAGSGHAHSARENVAPDDSDALQGVPAAKASTVERIPLEPTLPQPQPAATTSTELPPATAPIMTPQAPAQDGVVQLTPEAQRAKDQEEVYRAWQRAHEEAEQEKRRRTRRHHEIAAQEKREQEEREATERRAEEERQVAEKQLSNPSADDQRVSTTSTQSGGSSGQHQASGPTPAGRTSVVVPTAATEPKADNKLQTPPVGHTVVPTDAVKPRRGFLCCLCRA